jgi:hypothetical protein
MWRFTLLMSLLFLLVLSPWIAMLLDMELR